MLTIIITSIVGFISFALLDYTWLAHVAKNFYLSSLASHVTLKDGSLVPYLPAVPLVYIVAIIGIWFFILKQAVTLPQAFLYGALFGFLMYAFYDFTNLATLRDYSWSITLVDIIWGTFAMGVVSGIMFYIKGLL